MRQLLRIVRKHILPLILIAFTASVLSGCLVAAAGVGAVGGYQFSKHYEVKKKSKTS